jgi:glutamyl-tRNA synthetase
VNAHYMKTADSNRIFELVAATLSASGSELSSAAHERLKLAMPLLQDRGKTVVELAEQIQFVIAPRPLNLDAKAKTQLNEETVARLLRLKDKIKSLKAWELGDLEALLKDFALEEGIGFGKFGPALRAVLTAGLPSPDLGRVLAALGRNESIQRMDDSLS